MKIGITCQPTAGGSGIMATELGIALAERGHTVHFVTQDRPFRLHRFRENIFSHYVDAVSYPLFSSPPYSLALATKISEVAEEHDIQLWHVHYAIPNAAAALFARDMLPPEKQFCIVTTLHGTDITLVGSDPSFYRITRYAMERSCAVTAVSDWLAEETQREFGLSKKIRRIYNFLDTERFAHRASEGCRLDTGGRKVMMHISNFRPVKRVTDVVRIFKRVTEEVDACLVMIGEGPERMAAVGVAKQLGIADRIKYLGNCEDIESVIACADLVVQPSEHESFGMVSLEAMACGVPVICTNSGGVNEVVEHGVTGFLCDVGDIESMASHAIGLLQDGDRAKAMGAAGRKRALTHFSKDDMVAQYLTLYEEVLAEAKKQRARAAGA